jgi:hypothetical protein
MRDQACVSSRVAQLAPRKVAYMRSTNWLGSSIVIAGLCLAAMPAFAQQQQGQSQSSSSSSQQQSQDASSQDQGGDAVADAARKAREQQKTAPKPKKVYTDDDVKPATPPPSEAPAAKAASSDSQGAAEGDASKADAGAGKDDPETMWRKKFADQRAKIAAAEKELDILQQEEQKAEVQYYPDPQKALQEQYTRQDINDKLAKIDAKKKEIDDLKQQLDDMEDELRKSGGDPGWAREP